VKVKILLNPYANRWAAKSQAPAVEAACQAAHLDYDLTIIPAPGGGIPATIAALQDGCDAVVAAGGDGTVSEVVNGLIHSAGDAQTKPLGVIPLGTGNDFSDMANLPRDIRESIDTIVKGHVKQIDAGRVTVDGEIHYFDNNCAIAMEPMVTLEHIRMTRTSGNIRYVLALLRSLVKLKAWQLDLQWDQGDFRGDSYVLSVCNSPRTGGIFQMAPGAQMDDGQFDFVMAPDIGKSRIPLLLARLFRGKHIHDSRVIYERTSRIEILCDPPTPVHADGEIIGENARHILYEILPGKITLLAPDR
jgi:YegS/Rv2252/BmrU family lipid kinase